MNRILCLLLTAAMLLSMLSGCAEEKEDIPAEKAAEVMVPETTAEKKSASAFEQAQSAYGDLCEAYELISQLAFDLHNVWRVGAHEASKANGNFVEYLAPKLEYLSREEFTAGVARAIAWDSDGKKWASLSDAEKKSYMEFADTGFYIKSDYFQYFCISSVLNSYYLTGEIQQIRDLLKSAKEQLRELNEQDPDYALYGTLKKFYISLDAYFELCYSDGDGGAGVSFNQFKELRSAYIKEAQDYMGELGFELDE